MSAYVAHILGPRGSSRRLDIMADDMQHARELALGEAWALFGRRGFSFTVMVAA